MINILEFILAATRDDSARIATALGGIQRLVGEAALVPENGITAAQRAVRGPVR